MNIQFFAEHTDFSLSNEGVISKWIKEIIHSHKYSLSEINYIFCSDEYLLEVNQRHLDHDYYTDIITFDNSDEQGVIESDIFISIDRVRENAVNQNERFENELNRVMIHGVLHLLGYSDKSKDEKKAMREKEDACLSLLKI
ncbi:MAG: rRNA maturation RNase YbeY [Ekhidna sp.]|uniref:rRNA maturation RNase YbeY n=1 Tax=Ekhidna sp. TaxID=2608089 RepID=UPI0032EEFBDA